MKYAREDQDEFARLIARWRRRRGLSQEALGALINLSQRHISFIETGRTRPSSAALLRVISALMVSPADGNRLLNLLGYRASIIASEQDWLDEAPQLMSLLRTIIRGLEPLPASAISDVFGVRCMSLVQALWWNEVAQYPEVFADGYLCHHRAVFHPQGMRRFTENWEEFATAYLQVALRERLRRPQVGEKVLNEILALTRLPSSWLELSVDVPNLASLALRQKTALGTVNLTYTTHLITQPTSHQIAAYPEMVINYLRPADERSAAILTELRFHAKPEDVHERLQAALIDNMDFGLGPQPLFDDTPIEMVAQGGRSRRATTGYHVRGSN
jgi:transcriptional regulator with XRE-family HTH domain